MDWLKFDLLPLDTYKEKFRDIFSTSGKNGESITGSVADIHHRSWYVLSIPVGGLEIPKLIHFIHQNKTKTNKQKNNR